MQTKQFVKASVLVLLMSACGNSKEISNQAPASVVNLVDQQIISTLWMQHSFEVKMLQEQQFKRAEMMLKENLKKVKSDKKPAVILDIDETVLDNSPYEARLIRNGEAYTPASWDEWVKESQASLIPGAQDFLVKAESMGVEIFYISNRELQHLEPTLENLRIYNLPGADESHVLLRGDDRNKTERREAIKPYFNVVLYVGDQLSDFIEEVESFSPDRSDNDPIVDSAMKYFVILPNPMYGNFEERLYPKDNLSDKKKDEYRRDALITKRKK